LLSLCHQALSNIHVGLLGMLAVSLVAAAAFAGRDLALVIKGICESFCVCVAHSNLL